MGKVHFDRRKDRLVFDHAERQWNGSAELVLHESDLAHCTVVELKHALDRAAEYYGGLEEAIHVTTVAEEDFDEDYSHIEPISFAYSDGDLSLVVDIFNDGYQDDAVPPDFKGLLSAILFRHGLRLTSGENDSRFAGRSPYPWYLKFDFNHRARTLRSLFLAGLEIAALLDATSSGRFTRVSIGDLVRSGRADLLVGQKEGHWLEAKRQHYDLQSLSGKVSLAQAVARFCNSEEGGLIVVGAETKDKGFGDTIIRISPMPADPKVKRQYQQALHNHLYPPPDAMQLEVAPYPDGDLVLIDIPPQPEELKPFLVHGALVDGRGEGAFISIVRRRDDVSIPTTAAMIHSTIAAGRALLRGSRNEPK